MGEITTTVNNLVDTHDYNLEARQWIQEKIDLEDK